MNLHGLVSGYIGAVNPNVQVTLKKSTGRYTKDEAGVRTPIYERMIIPVQVQALTFGDIQKMEGLNIQGIRRAIYANGEIAGLIRVSKDGGDLIEFPIRSPSLPELSTLMRPSVWLCAHVLEQWPNWVKIAITLQDQ